MERSRVRWTLPVVALSVALAACGSSSEPARSPSSSPTGGPGTVSLAVLASAADPNALEDGRARVVAALGEGLAQHVVVSPGGCYTGLPARYGDEYVLAIWETDEPTVRADVADANDDAAWVGDVVATCVD